MIDLPAAFFKHLGKNSYEPSEATIGAWSPGIQHGGPPSALLTHALRNHPSSGEFNISRITVEILSPVPVTPCEISVTVVRGGKRVELLRGEYISEGKTYLIAHAWRLLSEAGVTTKISDSYEVPSVPGPQLQKFCHDISFPYGAALEWRYSKGDINTLGPAIVWTKPKIPLIENLETAGIEALVLMIDSANGVSAELDYLKWSFVPVDMTVGIYRQPVGPWIGMDARTVMEEDGVGQSTTVCFDSKGKIGQSMHTLFIRPR